MPDDVSHLPSLYMNLAPFISMRHAVSRVYVFAYAVPLSGYPVFLLLPMNTNPSFKYWVQCHHHQESFPK